MQFLVVTRQSAAPPLETMSPLMDAMDGCVAGPHRASGKIKEVWSFAGFGGGGGGVLEVDGHEDLGEIMGGFLWGRGLPRTSTR